jgi:uncharacterized membrane protein (UPF0182 family)
MFNRITNVDQLYTALSEITDQDLAEKASEMLNKLCHTHGKSFTMSVPVSPNDTDMIFVELIRRFKSKTDQITQHCSLDIGN